MIPFDVFFKYLLPGTVVITIVLYLVVEDAKRWWRGRAFVRRVKDGVMHRKLTYPDLENMAAFRRQNRSEVLLALQSATSDAVDSGSSEEQRTLIRSLIAEHQKKEPFAELPEHVGLQLADIQSKLLPDATLLPRLAQSLGELYEKNRRELLFQKRVALSSFAVGVGGVVLALWPMFFPRGS